MNSAVGYFLLRTRLQTSQGTPVLRLMAGERHFRLCFQRCPFRSTTIAREGKGLGLGYTDRKLVQCKAARE